MQISFTSPDFSNKIPPSILQMLQVIQVFHAKDSLEKIVLPAMTHKIYRYISPKPRGGLWTDYFFTT